MFVNNLATLNLYRTCVLYERVERMMSYSIDRAAPECGLSARTLRREASMGLLVLTKVRGRVLVLDEDLRAYLSARRINPMNQVTSMGRKR